MIKFFRHIRKSLIEDNKMGKYFKYAIGEILLVVIGILIALQVNNWNTERKKQITQTNYLEEIKANLEDDLLEILRVREFNQVKAKSIETAFKIFNEHPDPIEYMPLFSNQMFVLTEFDVFTPNRIAFDNMVASESIDLVSSQELRSLLSEYYKKDYSDGTQERVKEITRQFTDYAGRAMMNRQTIKMLTNSDSNVREMSEVTLHNDETFYAELVNMRMIINGHNEFLDAANEEITTLISLLDNKLNVSND